MGLENVLKKTGIGAARLTEGIGKDEKERILFSNVPTGTIKCLA